MKGKLLLISVLAASSLLAFDLPPGVSVGKGPMPTPKPYNFERALVKDDAKLQKEIEKGKKYSLIQVYDMALKYDYELKTGLYELRASNSADWVNVSRLLPTFKAHAGYNGDEYDMPTHGKTNESFYSYGVSVNQQIFRPDLWMEKEQSALRVTGSKYAYQNTRQNLAKKVSKAYFDYVFAKQSLLLAKSYEKAHELRYKQMQKSLNMGLVNKMDYLEAKVRYDQSVLGVSKAVRELDIARLSLANLVGKNVQVSDYIKYDNLNVFKNKDLKKYYNFAANLEYKQADINTKIAAKESTKRKMEYLPTIDLYASYESSIYSDRTMFKTEDKKDNVVIMANFSMPIFTSGLVYNRIQEAKYQKQASLARQENTRNLVELQQKQAISDFQNYIQEFKISQRTLDHAMVYEKAIDAGYREGLKDLVELLDAKARIHETKLNYIKSANSLIASYLELESLIGGIDEQLIRNLDSQIVMFK